MLSKIILILSSLTLVTACNNQFKADPNAQPKTTKDRRDESFGKLTGDDGIIIGSKKKRDTVGITVNAFLWRSALEVVNTLPIILVDPFSGVITTDWYIDNTKEHRYKMNIIINSDTIRADAVKVTVFTQQLTKNGWQDLESNTQLGTEIENRILTRARFLKINN